MIKFNYQILKYTHDQITGEFVNVGIVVFVPEQHFLEAKVISKFSRISNFFEDINGDSLLHSLLHFQKEIESVRDEMGFFGQNLSLRDITAGILTRDDSAVQLSDVKTGMDINLQRALDDLFYRMANKYSADTA